MDDQSWAMTESLNELEKGFVRAVERGEAFKPAAAEAEESRTIDGRLIRAMLLGTPLKDHPRSAEAGEPVAVAVTASGIRLTGPHAEPEPPPAPAGPSGSGPAPLRISGPLDLGGLAGQDGGFLPGLQLDYCLIDEPIELSGSRLQSLRLKGTHFSRLCAVNAAFNGSVTLTECSPRRGPPDRREHEFLDRTIAAVAGPTDKYVLLDRKRPFARPEACACALCGLPAAEREHAQYDGRCDYCCDLDFDGAQIGGSLEIVRTYLRAAGIVGRRYQTPKITDKFAAFLDGVKVGRSIVIERSVFVGRCSLRSAAVTDDVWVLGGKFVSSVERATFDFQLATIGGLLIFRASEASRTEEAEERKPPKAPAAVPKSAEPQDKSAPAAAAAAKGKEKAGAFHVRAFPVVVIGHISAVSLRVGEVWIGEGFYFGRDSFRRGGHATINFGKCDVGRTFKIGTYHEVQDPGRASGPAWIQGEISLVAANLGKNLEIHGALHDGIADKLDLGHDFYKCVKRETLETPHLRLHAQNLKVDRRVYISRGQFCDSDPPPRGGRRGRKSAAVDFWKSTMGSGLRLVGRSHCKGAIRLNNCVIGREAIIRCEMIKASPEDLRRAERRGRIPCLIDISESTIDGHLKIGRPIPPADLAAGHTGRSLSIQGGISLQSTRIQGSVLLGHMTIDLSQSPSPVLSAVPSDAAGAAAAEAAATGDADAEPNQLRKKIDREDARIAIDLRGCDCAADFEVRELRWKLPKPVDNEKPGTLAAKARPRRGTATGRPPPQGGPQRSSRAFTLFGGRIGEKLGMSHFRLIHEGFYAVVDLRGFRCAMLLDGFGADWGFIYRIQLRVAGLRIGEVEPVCHRGRPGDPATRPEPHRLRWLAHQHVVQPATEQRETTDRKPRRIWLPERLVSTWRDEFVPHAYQVFSSAYRRGGEDLTADRILVEKKDTQNTLQFWRLLRRWKSASWAGWIFGVATGIALVLLRARVAAVPGLYAPTPFNEYWSVVWPLFVPVLGLVVLWPLVTALFQLLFKWLFLYGLSAVRGLLVFATAIGLGGAIVHVWRYGGPQYVKDWSAKAPDGRLDPAVALVLEVPPQPSAGDAAVGGLAAGTRAETKPLVAGPSPCNAEVDSFLYALDTFLPVIDLDQERRCSIRGALSADPSDRYRLHRVLKAMYELAGWLVTSLLILTVTGVLRRDLER